jgi:hypothetical protein
MDNTSVQRISINLTRNNILSLPSFGTANLCRFSPSQPGVSKFLAVSFLFTFSFLNLPQHPLAIAVLVFLLV